MVLIHKLEADGFDHNAKLKKGKIFIICYKIQRINNLISTVKLFPYSSM